MYPLGGLGREELIPTCEYLECALSMHICQNCLKRNLDVANLIWILAACKQRILESRPATIEDTSQKRISRASGSQILSIVYRWDLHTAADVHVRTYTCIRSLQAPGVLTLIG